MVVTEYDISRLRLVFSGNDVTKDYWVHVLVRAQRGDAKVGLDSQITLHLKSEAIHVETVERAVAAFNAEMAKDDPPVHAVPREQLPMGVREAEMAAGVRG